MKILLTGTRSPVTLDLVRAFTSCGHEVHGADSLRFEFSARALSSFTLIAAPNTHYDVFAADAQNLIDRLKPDLIVPLCEDVFHWTRLGSGQGWPLFAPPLERLMTLHSKYEFIELAKSLGLNVPETRRFLHHDDADPSRYVFKPEYSRFGEQALIRPNRAPVSRTAENPWVRQAWVDGEDVSFHALSVNGTLTAFSAYRSRWRNRGGASYYFEPVDSVTAAHLHTIARQLVEGLGLHGQLGCDLRIDPNGDYWLIECNPRATSGLHLLSHDPQALSAAFLGAGSVLQMSRQPACFGPAMCLFGLPVAVSSGQLPAWSRDLKRARDVIEGQRFAVLSDGLRMFVRGLLRGQSLAAVLTADIECNRDLTCL